MPKVTIEISDDDAARVKALAAFFKLDEQAFLRGVFLDGLREAADEKERREEGNPLFDPPPKGGKLDDDIPF